MDGIRPAASDGSDVKVEWLTAGDLPEVAAIEAAVFPEPLSLANVRALFAKTTTCYLGIRRPGGLAAYFGFELQGPTAHVIANATHPAHRRLGFAARVLKAGEDAARQRGARWFLGEVRRSNLVQVEILTALGWKVVGECPQFFGNGEDAFVVWRCL